MRIGCPREVKEQEYRVGLVPAAVKAYVESGHSVFIQKGAGEGSGILDTEYTNAGATMLDTAEEVWDVGDMIVKVKEPVPVEFDRMETGQTLFTYFHFAADERLTRACVDKGISAVAYETVQEENGSLPLLKPMSEVAGRMAPLVASFYLSKMHGGRGLLPTGVPGVAPADVLIIGGGTVGSNAAQVAAGLGSKVTILDINIDRLEELGKCLPPNVFPVYGDGFNLERGLREAAIVIGAVLIPGAKAPKLIKREHLRTMKPGAVLVDVAIDQGGCAETSRPTTHADPVYVVDDVIHYCVANMPGAYARTSTFALNNRTIRYGLKLAANGVEAACRKERALKNGLNMHHGRITFQPVAEALKLHDLYTPADEMLK